MDVTLKTQIGYVLLILNAGFAMGVLLANALYIPAANVLVAVTIAWQLGRRHF